MDSQEDDPITEIRMKYVEDLEDILQCPVCLESPEGLIPTCSKGHHICSECRKKINKCPTCQEGYPGSRNFMGESLALAFDKIKKSLLDPNYHLNRKIKKKNFQTQTDPLSFYKMNSGNDSAHKNNTDSSSNLDKKTLQKSKYNCIKDSCDQKLTFNEISKHIKDYHDGVLVEVEQKKGVVFYENTWTFSFENYKSIDYAISVKNVGLFFFVISLDENYKITSSLKILSDSFAILKFYYYISFENGQSSKGFDGTVVPEKNSENNQHNSESSVTYELVDRNAPITCTLRLYNNNAK